MVLLVPMLLLLAAMPHHATPTRTNINTGRKSAGSMKEELAKVLEQFSSITDGWVRVRVFEGRHYCICSMLWAHVD